MPSMMGVVMKGNEHNEELCMGGECACLCAECTPECRKHTEQKEVKNSHDTMMRNTDKKVRTKGYGDTHQ